MSELKVNKLTGKTTAGDITVTSEGGSATQSLQQGLAKAWFEYTSITSTALSGSFGISGLVDGGTGDSSLSFTNNMSSSVYVANAVDVSYNTSYNTSVGCYIESSQNTKQKTSSTFTLLYSNHASLAMYDHCENMGTVHGDLA